MGVTTALLYLEESVVQEREAEKERRITIVLDTVQNDGNTLFIG